MSVVESKSYALNSTALLHQGLVLDQCWDLSTPPMFLVVYPVILNDFCLRSPINSSFSRLTLFAGRISELAASNPSPPNSLDYRLVVVLQHCFTICECRWSLRHALVLWCWDLASFMRRRQPTTPQGFALPEWISVAEQRDSTSDPNWNSSELESKVFGPGPRAHSTEPWTLRARRNGQGPVSVLTSIV